MTTATATAFTVVCCDIYDMEAGLDYDVYAVRHGELFATREDAEAFAGRMNETPAGERWFHYTLTTAEAQAVL